MGCVGRAGARGTGLGGGGERSPPGPRGERAAQARGSAGRHVGSGPLCPLSVGSVAAGTASFRRMATGLRCVDSMPCHNQKLNSASTLSAGPPRPGDEIADHAAGSGASGTKPGLLTGRARSDSPAEGAPEACGAAGHSADSSLGDCEVSRQIGAQLKLLPMNEQIRELQTIIRDK